MALWVPWRCFLSRNYGGSVGLKIAVEESVGGGGGVHKLEIYFLLEVISHI